MNSTRKTAKIVGALYIIALASAMLRSVLLDSILDAPGYLTNLSSSESEVILGVLLLFIMGVAVPSIAIAIYPILRKQNMALALSYVGARLIECVLFIITVLSVLTLLTLSEEYVKAGAPVDSYFSSLGVVLLGVRDWAFNVFWPIVLGLAALIFYYLLYQSKLIPRWLSIWGYFGAVSALAGGVLSYFGFIGTLSTIYNLLLLQIALQEVPLAFWLIIRGFNPSAVASLNI